MRILLIEDNKNLAKYTIKALKEEGYAVDWVEDGDAGIRHIENNQPDLLLLDRMLPGMSGIDISHRIREQHHSFPILMMTALGEVDDRVEGLDSGADDYLVKPFEMSELLARVRSLLRRPAERLPEILTVQDVSIDVQKRKVHKGKKEIALTAKEFAILEYLCHHTDTIVTRKDLLDHCWEFNFNPFSNITDVYIRRIRRKLHDKNEKYVETIRGVGYRLKT